VITENAINELASLRFIKGSKAVIFRFILLNHSMNKPQAEHNNNKPYMWSVFHTDVIKAGKVCYYLAYDGAVHNRGDKVKPSLQNHYANPDRDFVGNLIQSGYGIGEEIHVPIESLTDDKPLAYWSELVKVILVAKYQHDADNHWLSIPLETIKNPLLTDTPEKLTVKQWNENRINFLEDYGRDTLVSSDIA